MLRWASRSPFFCCILECAGLTLGTRPSPTFVSRFASKLTAHVANTGTRVKLCASKASRYHGNASVSESKLCRKSAYDASGHAKISVHDVGTQVVDVNSCSSDVKALACSHHNAKSYPADGDVKVFGSAARMPHAKAHFSSGDVREADANSSSCGAQSPHLLMQTLFKQTAKEAQGVSADLQQKIELLESEQFSLTDARRLLKTRAFKSCSIEQLATALQELKRNFPYEADVVHKIVVRSSIVLLQPAEVVQQKLKLLRDFQVEEKVISILCSRGSVLSVRIESLQKKIMFFDDIGLAAKARNLMFLKSPRILILTIENSIQPPLKFLESTGITKQSILKLAQRCPVIFHMSLNTLMQKYEYIRQLGFSVDKIPWVLRFVGRVSIKNMERHLQSLRDLGFTDGDVHSMLQYQPAILALSSENVKCKVNFLIRTQRRNLAEVVRFPTCLAYSLQARIIPRFNVVNELGLSKFCGLSHILHSTDSKFEERFGKAIKFEKWVVCSAEHSVHENSKS